jgi:hypothetical protein
MVSYGKRAGWGAIKEKAFGALSDSYVVVGGTTTKATRVVKFTNNTDQTVYFTTDNTEDQLKLPANSYQLWDITTNKALAEKPQFIEAGTQFYCRYITGSAPSTGWVSVETLTVESGS